MFLLPTDCFRGYDDPNFRNGQVLTPTIDRMVAEGVEIKEFYVYKMCAPSRASVLSGTSGMLIANGTGPA